jgi:uncharacterized membrane protein required for colicin V production
MNSWNGLDFFIFLIFALNTVLGMSRGATKEIISMICLSVALIVTIKFTVPLATFFNSSPLISGVVSNNFVQNFMLQINAGPLTANLLKQLFYCISMLICFVGAFSICEAGLSVSGVTSMFSFPYETFDRKVGGSLGCVRGYVITLFLIVILALHIYKTTNAMMGNNFLSGSYFVRLFMGSAIKLDNIISEQQPEQYKEIYKGSHLFNANDVYKNTESGLPMPVPPPGQQAPQGQPAAPQAPQGWGPPPGQ